MKTNIQGKYLLHINYLFALLILIIIFSILGKCPGDFGCGILEGLFGFVILALSFIGTSVAFFWKNKHNPKKDLLYYYTPFIAIFSTMILRIDVLHTDILNTYATSPTDKTTTNILEPTVFVLGFFFVSILAFYAISHFSYLRNKILVTIIFSFLLFYLANIPLFIVEQYQSAQHCNRPNVYCSGSFLFPYDKKEMPQL